MALDKNDGVFLPSIEGVVSGKTSQVDGMNGIMNNLIGNDNYLKNKKLDRGNYVGSGELLRKDDDAIWGGECGGYIQDTSITKVVGKRYIDQFDKKAYECLVPSHENTITNYQACNVKDNLSKLNNLISYSKVWQLQAFFGSYTTSQNTFLQTSVQKKSIAIPVSYKELLCRYSFVTTASTNVNVEEAKLEELTIGQKLMSESFLVYEGKDSQFYYFHIETSSNWIDNNGFIYAR